MLTHLYALFALMLLIFAENNMKLANSHLGTDQIHGHYEKGDQNREVGAVIERMVASIQRRNAKESAARDKLEQKIETELQLKSELRPYFDQTKSKLKDEEELEDIEGALAEAQNQLANESGTKEEDKQAEIARIRDEINKIRYGLKERLQSILLGRKIPPVQALNKSESLNNITGATSWQTATWILLALCVFLSIVLIGAITHMISRKKNYERIKSSTLM